MDQLILQQIKNELINGSVKRGHPFKYITLGTLFGQIPHQRTVVLRKVQPNFHLLFYTDRRSAKVNQIKENSAVSALFYHPKKMIQLQIEGKAEIKENPELLQKIWKSIPDKSSRDYTTSFPPGTTNKNPEHIEYLVEDNHFCMVEIKPCHIEYLKLQRPYHHRIKFVRKGDDWNGTYLIP